MYRTYRYDNWDLNSPSSLGYHDIPTVLRVRLASVTPLIKERGDADLSKTFIELSEDTRFIEHLSLIAMFIVIGDALAKVSR